MSNVPLPEPDISVPFLSEVRKVLQGDYYRADKVLPLLKQWAVLYEAAKAGHEQAFAEAQNAAAVSAAKDAEIAQLRADAIDRQNNVVMPLRDRVRVLEDALRGLDEAYCRAGSPLTKAERHQDRMRLIAARAALEKP